MIKILFFIDKLTGGGAEKVLRTLVNNMDQSKFDITVHTLDESDPAQYLVPGIRYRAINRCKTALGKKLFHYWVRLCAELKWLYPLYIRDDYDIEVAYLECGPTKILSGSTNKKAKKVAWIHCDLEKRGMDAPEKAKSWYDRYDDVVCVSETVKRSFHKVVGSGTDTHVLYNVNDETDILRKAVAFEVNKPEPVTFLTVGRLSYEKGNDRLLEACKCLREAGHDFKLWLLGDGPERENLMKQFSALELNDQVSFWGFQTNPYPYMRSADIIVTPSRYEGFSTVVTEALILGKPVVTTPCSGMDELLGDSEFGLITEDSVDGIYQGMKRMMEDVSLRERYAQKAAIRGKDFSKDKLVKQTEQFFEELLK
ncbi:MAG: glycosyltransferase [Oscillospiraceae bacterium]|nr:glycosyltransferase [Oscillospiraceae bacterium]